MRENDISLRKWSGWYGAVAHLARTLEGIYCGLVGAKSSVRGLRSSRDLHKVFTLKISRRTQTFPHRAVTKATICSLT